MFKVPFVILLCQDVKRGVNLWGKEKFLQESLQMWGKWGQRINLVGGLHSQEYNFASLYMKNLMSVTPLNCVLKALIFALNDSADAFVRRCSK